MDRSWMSKPKQTAEYSNGVKEFIECAFTGVTLPDEDGNMTILCPCLKCNNVLYQTRKIVETHLMWIGIVQRYTTWIYHGEEDEVLATSTVRRNIDVMRDIVNDATGVAEVGEFNLDEETPNEDAKRFYRLLEECETSLYPGCIDYSKMSYIVELLHLKSRYRISNVGIGELMKFFKKCLPSENTAPGSYAEAKKIVSDLGLGYEKIDACRNDCVLFYKEHANAQFCPVCKESRWEHVDTEADHRREEVGESTRRKRKKVAAKTLRYFPLKPRLKRYFMSEKTAAKMRWHHDGRIKDGVLRHPADTPAWQALDNVQSSFGSEPRNVRLGLATDGFNPFGSGCHSMWPVILIPYNLPPDECMKDPNYLLSMIIPGPSSPTVDIDVYLQPLMDELRDLWDEGVMTYDASKKETFCMRAAILWTINDFPAYGMLSGWTTMGYKACPICMKDTCSCWLKHGRKCSYRGNRRHFPIDHKYRANKASFDGKKELQLAPTRLSGAQVLDQLNQLPNIPFGKKKLLVKRKRPMKQSSDNSASLWKKKSIFFQLPYWKYLLLRHNLDVMHIEKNVCENIMNTLLGVDGRSNDNLNAREDMKIMRIRPSLHPIVRPGSKKVIPPACHTLSTTQKKLVLKFLKGLKVPGGFSSNISRCIKLKERKISGLKSHDYHVLMQRLLPISIRGVLPKNVCKTLVHLSQAFNTICAKELKKEDLQILEHELPIIMCKLEMIFPPAFFDITVHLIIHLVEEVLMAGPVRFRWMYFIEMLMGKMKSFVRNRKHPEASIAEGFVVFECMTFCSRYLDDAVVGPNINRRGNVVAEEPSHAQFSIFCTVGRPLGGSKMRNFSNTEMTQCQLYILQNCTEVQPYIVEHRTMLSRRRLTPRNLEEKHNEEFLDWFHHRVKNLGGDRPTTSEMLLQVLARPPLPSCNSFSGYDVKGFRFHTKETAMKRVVQNCGVVVNAETMCFSSGRDRRPQSAAFDYYGILREVLEVQFSNIHRVVLFKCDWYDVINRRSIKRDEFGYTSLKDDAFMSTNEPFILASQARQVFYAWEPEKEGWSVVVHVEPHKRFDMGLHMLSEGVEPFQECSTSRQLRSPIRESHDDFDDFNCNRFDIEGHMVDDIGVHEEGVSDVDAQNPVDEEDVNNEEETDENDSISDRSDQE